MEGVQGVQRRRRIECSGSLINWFSFASIGTTDPQESGQSRFAGATEPGDTPAWSEGRSEEEQECSGGDMVPSCDQ